MIEFQNHDSLITSEVIKSFPSGLKDAYDFYQSAKDLYDADTDIKETIDLYFHKVNAFIKSQEKKAKKPSGSTSTALVPINTGKKNTKKRKTGSSSKKATAKPKAVKTKRIEKPTARKKVTSKEKTAKKKDNSTKVSALSPEVKVAKRAVGMHGKGVAKSKLATFIKYLQRLILRKEIRKSSPFASTIMALQKMAVNFHNGMHSVETFNLPEELYTKLSKLASDEKVRTSVNLINRYIGLINSDERAKLRNLTTAIEKAVTSGKLTKSDPYAKQVDEIYEKLKSVLEHNRTLQATESELSGLKDILAKLGIKPGQKPVIKPTAKKQTKKKSPKASQKSKQPLAGIDTDDISKAFKTGMNVIKDTVKGFTASDALHKKLGKNTFRLPGTIGELLGELERYKLAITIEGDQGAGKTRFVYQLANAFIEPGFTVGNFSLEIGDTSHIVQNMVNRYLNEKNKKKYFITGHADHGIDTVRKYANDFDVIIIDSWNKLDVDSSEFDNLRRDFPNTIWIVIFQRTSQGTIRGGTRPLYDAGINLEAVKSDKGFAHNYIHATKNRYGDTYHKYYIDSQSFTPPMDTAPSEKVVPSKSIES